MALTDVEIRERDRSRAIRGYIIRCLIRSCNNTALTKHLSNSLFMQGYIMSPDIKKYIDYLVNGGYIEFTDKKVKAYTIYADDAVVKLTNKGINLAEGTIEDPGVEM